MIEIIRYRITKYNPAFRSQNGFYLLNDWTSIHDIGKSFFNGILTEKIYFDMENKYIKVLMWLLDENKITSMYFSQLEKYTKNMVYDSLSNYEKKLFSNIKKGATIDKSDISIIFKMILRELIWAELVSNNNSFTLEFGYDYYMYVRCKEISKKAVCEISKEGLYVERLS